MKRVNMIKVHSGLLLTITEYCWLSDQLYDGLFCVISVINIIC